jgi:hypothetical protein
MFKKFILMLALGLCIMSPAKGLNIIWVCTAIDNSADGVQDDAAWIPWLQSLGHTVDVQIGNWATLDDTKIATLNAADVIIISRAMASDSTAGSAAEIAQWNAIKKPIISLNAYNTRSSRNLWVNSTTINNLVAPMMAVQVPGHPIFAGITLDASNQVAVVDGTTGTGQTSFIGTLGVGNGKLLAQTATGTNAWIVEWQAGAPFYSGSGDDLAGKRLLFCAGTQESGATPTGAFNLTDVGKKMLNNAIYYMAGKTLSSGIAMGPQPADGATDVPRDTNLSWTPSEGITQHDVYFGTASQDVNAASRTAPAGLLVSQGQDANTFDPAGVLQLGQTYYWRVDEVNNLSSKIVKGAVWSFTVEPFAYPMTNITATASGSSDASSLPVNTINGSGLTDDLHGSDPKTMWRSNTTQPIWIQYNFDRIYKVSEMWVWNHNSPFEEVLGFGVKDATLEYSIDGTTWTKLGDFEFAQAPGTDDYAHDTTVPFDGVAAKAVRITVNSSWGGGNTAGLSEVRFFYIPVLAREPDPASGVIGVRPDVTLSWRPGRQAASHNVYVSTDAAAVTNGTASFQSVTGKSYTPSGLLLSTTYYWRVDEVNTADAVPSWAGDVWSFTTADYVVVDDMEGYTDDEPKRIYDVWIDGYGTTNNGSQVGNNVAPFAEKTIVHSGSQSMPFLYNNTSAANSEATRTFTPAQDWTIGGIKTLVVYFRGDPANTTGQLFVKINSTKVAYPGNAAAEASIIWTPWLIDLTGMSGLKAVNTLTIGVSGTGQGKLYIDDIRLYRSAPAVAAPVDPGTTGLVSSFDMEGGKVADSVSGITGTLTDVTFAASLAGLGQAAQFNGTTSYVDLGANYWTNVLSKLSSCTFALWVNYTGQGAVWQRVFDFGSGPNTNVFLTTGAGTAGLARFVVKTNVPTAGSTAAGYVETTVSVARALTVGWHHIAGVVDATGTPVMSLYVDGALVAGPSASRLPKDMVLQADAPWQMWLGRSQYTADPYFNGSIDNLKVYNRALTAGEVVYLAGGR